MLSGREDERARIERLLEQAASGKSGALLLRGESGIGKSALLDFALRRAEGFRVLSARGIEGEFELPFAALNDLLRPVLHLLDEIPDPQAAALRSAFALAPPTSPDRFAAAAGALSLLGAAAEDIPVLAVVDDLHWVDPASTEALTFAARRIDSEGVVLLMAARDRAADPVPAGLEEMRLSGLDRAATRHLLERHSSSVVADDVAAKLGEATASNPLALIEIVAALTEAQRSGAAPLPDPLPAGEVVVRDFLERIERLSEETRWALTVAAAAGSDRIDTIVRAMGGEEALVRAEAGGDIEVTDGKVLFRHPLFRSAVYRAAPAGLRRAAHKALADAAGPDELDERAWHLAAGIVEPDETVAAVLEQTGRRSLAGGGNAEAAAAFERAAQLTPEPDARTRRELLAAGAAQLAGDPDKASASLLAILGKTDDPGDRAELLHRLGVMEIWRGDIMQGRDRLLEESERVTGSHPGIALSMLLDAVIPSFMATDVATAQRTANAALQLAKKTGSREATARGLLAFAHYLAGSDREAESIFEPAESELLGRPGSLMEHPQGQQFIWLLLIGLERFDEARRLVDGGIAAARRMGAPSLLPTALAFRSELNFREGHWERALADASESVELAESTKQRGQLGHSLMMLARIEAARGREEACRAHCAQAVEIATDLGTDGILPYSDYILGLLELGMGRPAETLLHLEALARRVEKQGLGRLAVVYWLPDLVEAYILTGEMARADALLATMEADVRATGRLWALGAAARCRAMLAPDDEFREMFEAALQMVDAGTAPFGRARTRLRYGERLRRSRNRVEAREQLRAALTTFEELGAEPWAERARAELRASGEHLRRDPVAREELTDRELQVALIVASGATNEEAAAALFVSPKTIEAHLGRIYRKLGLRSRTELAAHVLSDPR